MPTFDANGDPWIKSSFSGANGCVEILRTESAVLVRDSKDTNGPVLAFSHDAWRQLLDLLRSPDLTQ